MPTKHPPEHKDIIGRTLNVGDFVSVVIYNKLQVAKIIKLTPKMVRVKMLNAHHNFWYNGEHSRYSSDMALLDGMYLTTYLIKEYK